MINWGEWENSEEYETQCVGNDWLKTSYNLWTLIPRWNYPEIVVYAADDGCGVPSDVGSAMYSYNVKPTVYLKENVKITSGTGAYDSPYELFLTE